MHKVEALNIPNIASRRTGVLSTDKLSKSSLHIEYNQPKVYDDNLTDNKIDVASHIDEKYHDLNGDKIKKIIGNYTQKEKDKNLSKIVVNELKSGIELIGDKNAPVMSNITFTPENDTLTAMAFIAGNLLNQLWNMEKDSNEGFEEADNLKHEKISDLLNLFKVPLNLRQESFLKNALNRLSEVIDKDKNLENVSLCDKISEATMTGLKKNETSEEDANETTQKINHEKCRKAKRTEKSTEKLIENHINNDTISKISNVLSLLKKIQNTRKQLKELNKASTLSNQNNKLKPLYAFKTEVDETLTKDESESLNVFGNVLEKITKLLLPPKKSKKVIKGIKHQNVFKKSQDVSDTLKSVYNIDVDDSTLTAKDKIVLDYLNTVKRNPKCLLDNLKSDSTKSVAAIEGDILLNLSEFFKVKSFVDLIKLLEPQDKPNVRALDETATKQLETSSWTIPTTTYTTEASTTPFSNKLTQTKDKLKSHLKIIIEDLIELQNAKGQPTNNISIVDALPCIFNKDTQNKRNNESKNTSPAARVTAIFNSLKKDLRDTPTRRNNIIDEMRPKAAIVWERIVKNFDGKTKKNNRRSMEIKEPKSFDELRKQMDKIESGSKLYKNTALTSEVPVSDRLVLLKTLSEDTQQYIKTLEDISYSLSSLINISMDEKTDLDDFLSNAAADIRLNKKIESKIINLKASNSIRQNNSNNISKKPKGKYIQSMKMLDGTNSNHRNNVKLSREAVINQLIRNRMQLYVKMKEMRSKDLNNDINYDIAKKILEYMNGGNHKLARELYKVLIAQKRKTVDSSVEQLSGEKIY